MAAGSCAGNCRCPVPICCFPLQEACGNLPSLPTYTHCPAPRPFAWRPLLRALFCCCCCCCCCRCFRRSNTGGCIARAGSCAGGMEQPGCHPHAPAALAAGLQRADGWVGGREHARQDSRAAQNRAPRCTSLTRLPRLPALRRDFHNAQLSHPSATPLPAALHRGGEAQARQLADVGELCAGAPPSCVPVPSSGMVVVAPNAAAVRL